TNTKEREQEVASSRGWGSSGECGDVTRKKRTPSSSVIDFMVRGIFGGAQRARVSTKSKNNSISLVTRSAKTQPNLGRISGTNLQLADGSA
ncbi:unnamed protein product, partial [Tenebrio molitor]